LVWGGFDLLPIKWYVLLFHLALTFVVVIPDFKRLKFVTVVLHFVMAGHISFDFFFQIQDIYYHFTLVRTAKKYLL